MTESDDLSRPTAITPLEFRAFVVALSSSIFGLASAYFDTDHIARFNPAMTAVQLIMALSALGLTIYWFRLRKRLVAQPRAQRPARATPIWLIVVGRLLSLGLLIALGALAAAFNWAEWIAGAGALAYAAWRTWKFNSRAKLGIAGAPYYFLALLGGCAIFELIGAFIGIGLRHS